MSTDLARTWKRSHALLLTAAIFIAAAMLGWAVARCYNQNAVIRQIVALGGIVMLDAPDYAIIGQDPWVFNSSNRPGILFSGCEMHFSEGHRYHR